MTSKRRRGITPGRQEMKSSKGKIVAVVVTVLVIVLVIVLRIVTSGGGENDNNQTAQPNKPINTDCTVLNVMASSEKAALLSEIANEFNQSDAASGVGENCGQVQVESKASGAALDALTASSWDSENGTQPDVWTPASTTWLRLLESERSKVDASNILPQDAPSIANTPLVIAMPKPMAEALGWPQTQLGWGDILKLANDPQGWGSVGHPEWGKFKLGKTNPNFSTSGLNATVGSYYAATGLSSDLTEARVNDGATVDYVKGVESSVVHYGDTTLTFLSNLQKAADEGKALSYISAVTVEEKSVWDYNQGNPTGDPATLGDHPKPDTPLVSIYPKEGTLYSDNPYAVLTGNWVTDAKKEVASAFLTHLQSENAQKRFTDAAFRSFEGVAGDKATEENGILADEPSVVITAPNANVLASIKDSWDQHRKRANVLLVMDVSGSMGDSAGSGESKLELAKKAALNALDQFAPDDEVGLWIFSTEQDSVNNTPYLELAPVAPISSNIDQLKEKITNLIPDGGTALYSTARKSVDLMRAQVDQDRINAVVLLTDGRNEYPEDSDLDSLLKQLSSGSEDGGVRLFTIGYGQDADLPTLQTMSEATRASSYDASNPETIDAVFTAVISNF